MKTVIAIMMVAGLVFLGSPIFAQEETPPEEMPVDDPASVPEIAAENFNSAAMNAQEAHARGKAKADFPQIPQDFDVSFTTLTISPLRMRALAGDSNGNLYVSQRLDSPTATSCFIAQVDRVTGALSTVGVIPTPVPITMAVGSDGMIYVGGGSTIYRFIPDASNPPTADVFATLEATGVISLAFDKLGNLWASESGAAQPGVTEVPKMERIYKIPPSGGTVTQEVFRIPPNRNSQALGGKVSNTLGGLVTGGDGVGVEYKRFPPGTPTNVLPFTAGANATDASANIAFDVHGNMYIADKGRGAIWRVKFDGDGNLVSNTGCDSTYTDNTLCADSIFVAHPYLYGVDSIALDVHGNIWASSPERASISFITANERRVIEVFRNPLNSSLLRSGFGTPTAPDPRDAHILESPHNVVILGKDLYVESTESGQPQNGSDNFPITKGQTSLTAGAGRGKISKMDQETILPGRPLPAGVD